MRWHWHPTRSVRPGRGRPTFRGRLAFRHRRVAGSDEHRPWTDYRGRAVARRPRQAAASPRAERSVLQAHGLLHGLSEAPSRRSRRRSSSHIVSTEPLRGLVLRLRRVLEYLVLRSSGLSSQSPHSFEVRRRPTGNPARIESYGAMHRRWSRRRHRLICGDRWGPALHVQWYQGFGFPITQQSCTRSRRSARTGRPLRTGLGANLTPEISDGEASFYLSSDVGSLAARDGDRHGS